jgi:serine/threonine protein kinase
MEIEYYRRQNWTYSKLPLRQQEFPQLKHFIADTASGRHERDSDPLPSSHHYRVSQCQYENDGVVYGEGGQGVLYRARDLVLGDREVAIKVVKDAIDANRFRQEAEVTAKLEHPGVVAVFSYSSDGLHSVDNGELVPGRPFYAMRLIHGRPLTERISEFHNEVGSRRVTLLEHPQFVSLIETLISACQVISYAHSVGVLHCDIKPQNIMCGEFGATTVLDWGSAVSAPESKVTSTSTRKRIKCPKWTSESQYTEAYASPEQKGATGSPINPPDTRVDKITSGRAVQLSEASDVFSLGATLYQIMTGRAPIDLPDYRERKSRDEIGAVRAANPNCPRRLEAICIKAMRLRPEDRYNSPDQLAHDLSAWLRGDCLIARPDNLFDSAFRFVNRHRVPSLLGLLSLLLATTFFVVQTKSQLQQQRLEASRDSGFTLIEEFCEPLENGELQNPESMRDVVALVEKHTGQHLRDQAVDPSEELMQARLRFLSALTEFYTSNYHSSKTSRTNGGGEAFSNAIGEMDQAVRLFEAQARFKRHSFSRERLARAWMFKGRLHFLQGQNNLSVADPIEQFRLALAALDSAQQIFHQSSRAQSETANLFRLAESYQLSGEIHQELSRRDGSDRQAEHHAASTAFLNCIETLNQIAVAENEPEKWLRKLRATGRGYGYLGDVYRDHAQFKPAYQSYTKSLDFRQQVLQTDNRAESKFQLARGYGNFVRTLRNQGVVPSATDPIEMDAISLDAIELEAERRARVVSAIEQYAGSRTDEQPKAIGLYGELAEKGPRSARREYGDVLCSISELYWYASNQGQGEEAARLMQLSRQFAEDARVMVEPIFKDYPHDKLAKTTFAYSLTLQLILDANHNDESRQRRVSEIIELLPKSEDAGATNDEILLRCIAMSFAGDSPVWQNGLQSGLKKLAQSGREMDWRIRQHFPPETLKTYLETRQENSQ